MMSLLLTWKFISYFKTDHRLDPKHLHNVRAQLIFSSGLTALRPQLPPLEHDARILTAKTEESLILFVRPL